MFPNNAQKKDCIFLSILIINRGNNNNNVAYLITNTPYSMNKIDVSWLGAKYVRGEGG